MIGTLTLISALSVAAILPEEAAVAKATSLSGKEVAFEKNGNNVKISGYDGKVVVLEWWNFECPYVVKHYDNSTNMQKLQKEFTDKGVVWLTINSSAAGKQGHVSAEKAKELGKAKGANWTDVLLDHSGVVGKMFDAKTTPHMIIIDKDGSIKYDGAIDSNRSADAGTIPGATNYVREALNAVLAGKPVATAKTQPYGCSVKYP
ncbi:MAG: redoxin family protein [Fimbriimonadaceae bacterium]